MATIAELDALLDDPERKVETHEGWTYGERVRVVQDDENEGLFEGTEGNLLIEKLGAAEYGNVRVGVFFVEDGMDGPVEVRDYDYIEGVI